jgi:hypothetical protein
MRKLYAVLLGLSLTFGVVSVIFAQDAPKKEETKKKKKKKTTEEKKQG